jgi:hypothetical protein
LDTIALTPDAWWSVWILVIHAIDSHRTEYVRPTSLPSTVSTAVPGGNTPALGDAVLSDEQPAVAPISSIAAAATQMPFSTAEM